MLTTQEFIDSMKLKMIYGVYMYSIVYIHYFPMKFSNLVSHFCHW